MDFKFTKKEIKFDKEINLLDKFVFDFIEILEKYTEYIIVSGYVSILFGRSRATDDVDITIPKLSKDKFIKFYKEINRKIYWFLNPENTDELYNLLENGNSVRIALKNLATPNIELRFIKTLADKESFKNRLKVAVSGHTLFTAPLELQIAYKEIILGDPKDKEDALHLREVFKEYLNIQLIEKYERLLEERKKHGEY